MNTRSNAGTTPSSTSGGHDDVYIAHLWEDPHLCLAFFGVQFLTPEGQQPALGASPR